MNDKQRTAIGAIRLWNDGDQDRFWLYLRKLYEYNREWWEYALDVVNTVTNEKR